jgi:group II intron reverse transcriptase/maturase
MEVLEQILSKNNLNQAYLQVYRNKGAGGVDGIGVDELKAYLREHGETIREQVRQRSYQPQPALRVEIPKENGKMRQLGIPTVVDRVLQQAVSQVLSPIFEAEFSDNSYGFRPHRSCEMAIIKALEYMNAGEDWLVDIDLERFFDTVNHDRLMRLLFNKITDGDVLSLIRKFLKSGVMVSGRYERTAVGTPQGGNLSPLLSNIMLNALDKELEKRGLDFVRYADDCMIFVRSEKAAQRVLKSVSFFIEKKLGLKVNAEKSKVSRPWETKYLGFGFYRNKQGTYRPKPHLKSVQKFQRKLKQLTKRNVSISLDVRIQRLQWLIRGWVNYFKIGDMKSVLGLIDAKLRSRIRVIIWKQWKKNAKRIKSLKQLGIPEEEAKGLTYCRKGYRFIAKSKVVHRALSNKRLEQRGIPFALSYYLKIHTVI